MKITIPFYYKNTEILLTWDNFNLLKYFAFAQHGRGMSTLTARDVSRDDFIEKYSTTISQRLEFFDIVFSKLPASASIINVGSGVSTLDALVSRIYNFKFYLLDKSSNSILQKQTIDYYSNTRDGHGYYNSWQVFNSLLENSNLDRSRFSIMSPDDDWPDKLDLVMSSYSWGWHYPVSIYWDKARHSLNPGSIVMLDIFNSQIDAANLITSELAVNPVVRPYMVTETSPFYNQYIIKDNSHGANYIWERT